MRLSSAHRVLVTLGSAAALAAAACTGSTTVPTRGTPSPSQQTAAAANQLTAIAAAQTTGTAAARNTATAVATATGAVATATSASTATPAPVFLFGPQVVTGSAGTSLATAQSQTFNATYDISASASGEGSFVTSSTRPVNISVSSANTNSRPQISVRTFGGAVFFNNAPNTTTANLTTGFTPSVATTTTYQFSVIDMGVAPAGINYTITISQ